MTSGLPIESAVPELAAALADRGSAVLVAEPGAGKTTIVPLRLLDLPWLDGRRIVMLEPRRLATRAAARRMADLVGDEVGGLIGYRTRDERRSGPRTRIEVVTEGVLTRRIQGDPELSGVGLVIFDEFHERNLHGDLGLALALDVRRSLRPDLRLLVMSATIDGDRIATLVGEPGAPATVVTCPGRTHPIDVRWRPRRPKDRLDAAVADAVERSLRDDEGDLLVFLPGAGEISRAADLLRPVVGPGVDVLALFGALPIDEQDRAIAPSVPGRRKVVLSTDIAETSLTVEGVKVVIDSGLAKVPRFDPRSGLTRLVMVSASRSSADQRAGRAGRLEPGVAYRLWSKIEHSARRPFAEPEITQVDLAGLVLELAVWGVRDPADLALLDQPPRGAVAEAREVLEMLAAIGVDGRPTDAGRRMATLPLNPRLARMVLGAQAEGHGWLACLLATALDERDVLRGRPDDLPADVTERVMLLSDPDRRHPAADGRAIRRVRDQARDLARRADVVSGAIDITAAGRVLAYAYPDRVAQARDGGRGRFRLRTGAGAWVPQTDPLAREPWIVAADLDGDRRDARVRLAAALDDADVLAVLGDQIQVVTSVAWDKSRDELIARTERRLDGLRLSVTTERPPRGPETARLILDRVRTSKLALLGWTDRARRLQGRVALCRRHLGEDWPDMSDAALMGRLEEWVVPFLDRVRDRSDVERLDVSMMLSTLLDFDQQMRLDRLTPASVTLSGGRKLTIDYSGDQPAVSVRVQELYGTATTPAVLDGRVPVVLHLLSPAGRPIQVTSDLSGFWAGSWAEVRKEMAGRYPKHEWPTDPATARPRKR